MNPRAEHTDRRVLLETKRLVEPGEPALDRVDPTSRAQRERESRYQPREALHVSGRAGVGDTGLGLAVRLAPGGRTAVQLLHGFGLALPELGAQEVSKASVVAVPRALCVEPDDEQVRVGERLEPGRRANRLEHGVAERPAHPLEHRGPGEEPHVARAQA